MRAMDSAAGCPEDTGFWHALGIFRKGGTAEWISWARYKALSVGLGTRKP